MSFSKSIKIQRARREKNYERKLIPKKLITKNFEKNHECKLIPNWTRKVVWLLINNIHEKINGRSVTGSEGSCRLCWMFGNSLDNVGKSSGECKNKHSDKFPKYLKIFGNLLKSSEIFGKKSENVAKCSRRPSSILKLFYEIFGSHRKSSEFFECLRKSSENFGNLSQSA